MIAAALQRARATMNERRIDSSAPTSPRTTPHRTYANGAPTVAVTMVEVMSVASAAPAPRIGARMRIDGALADGQHDADDERRPDRRPEPGARPGDRVAQGDRPAAHLAAQDGRRQGPALDGGHDEPDEGDDAQDAQRRHRRPSPSDRGVELGRVEERLAADHQRPEGEGEGPDRPEGDRADVERRPAHVLVRAQDEVEGGRQQASGGAPAGSAVRRRSHGSSGGGVGRTGIRRGSRGRLRARRLAAGGPASAGSSGRHRHRDAGSVARPAVPASVPGSASSAGAGVGLRRLGRRGGGHGSGGGAGRVRRHRRWRRRPMVRGAPRRSCRRPPAA